MVQIHAPLSGPGEGVLARAARPASDLLGFRAGANPISLHDTRTRPPTGGRGTALRYGRSRSPVPAPGEEPGPPGAGVGGSGALPRPRSNHGRLQRAR